MGAKKGLLRGSKISGKHSTVINEAEVVVEIAKKRSEVSKIVLGVINRVRSGNPRIKFVPINAGFRINVRGNNANQVLFVYTSNPLATEEAIRQAWEKSCK